MSTSPLYETVIPADHAGERRMNEAILKALKKDTKNDPAVVDAAIKIMERDMDKPTIHYSTGPMSISGDRPAWVRPQLSHMSPLAAALGLDREGGWKEVWRTMEQNRSQLCKLVWSILEWSDGRRAGNTYTYCFCTKYLPFLVSAVIDEPSPSIFDSPYDLILRGAGDTALLSYYLRVHPDKAIQLRDVYYRKTPQATTLKLDVDACYLHLCPHLLVVHTCIVAYATSTLSKSAQKNPTFPPELRSVAGSFESLIQPLLEVIRRNDPERSFHWPGLLLVNYLAFLMPMRGRDIRVEEPRLLGPEWPPAGSDFLVCGSSGLKCEERNPKKLKACSKCRVRLYCCVEHAKSDWDHGQHKHFCQKIVWDNA